MYIKIGKTHFLQELSLYLKNYKYYTDFGTRGTRNISLPKRLHAHEELDRQLITFINDCTRGKLNYAKAQVKEFFEQHDRILSMFWEKEKGKFYSTEKIYESLEKWELEKVSKLKSIELFVRACDLIEISDMSNYSEVLSEDIKFKIKDIEELILNRLHRVRDSADFFPIDDLLISNGVYVNRNEIIENILLNLNEKKLLDVNEKHARITVDGIRYYENNGIEIDGENIGTVKEGMLRIKKKFHVLETNVLIEKIKRLIEGRMDTELNTLILIQKRFYALQLLRMKGVESFENEVLTENKINQSLLNFVDSLLEKCR